MVECEYHYPPGALSWIAYAPIYWTTTQFDQATIVIHFNLDAVTRYNPSCKWLNKYTGGWRHYWAITLDRQAGTVTYDRYLNAAFSGKPDNISGPYACSVIRGQSF